MSNPYRSPASEEAPLAPQPVSALRGFFVPCLFMGLVLGFFFVLFAFGGVLGLQYADSSEPTVGWPVLALLGGLSLGSFLMALGCYKA